MKFKELQNKTPEELTKLLGETKLELIKENAMVATGTIPKNPGKLSVLKKTIAKINQIQDQKKVGDKTHGGN